MAKIIFLDVDGVLNGESTKEHIPDTFFIGIDNTYVKRLKKIVDATDAMIVLSSTWRLHKTRYGQDIQNHCDYLIKKLAKQGLRYVSTTPDLEWCGNRRGHEIKKWLEDNNDIEVEGWVVLDDEKFMDFDECGITTHWVETYFYGNKDEAGLQEEHVEEAIRILNNELEVKE